ncbi:hypothetical protein B0H16DRAFT_1797918 [Mycena metata]|uniref:CxC6 like cysteine cluster associated with KDZ domain-containing protein n=1 Tax=Mycena metata TaxID=1033252 RepID=A0AAD7HE03_9AGAR|nr:hypothetical protein B0H16DRAFT_1797918 [Mycena metata]
MDSPLDYDSTTTYIELVRLLKPYLATFEPSYRSAPPEFLSIEAHNFLKLSIGVTDEVGKLAWQQLRSLVWARNLTPSEQLTARTKHIELFLEHGLSRKIGLYTLDPLTRVCIDPNCAKALLADPSLLRDRELVEPNTIPVTIFTKEFGSIPGLPHTIFSQLFVQATERTYYAGVSVLIQSSQHFYIDKELCELFSVMMVTSWTSATNCARTYNSGLPNEAIQSSLPATWSTSLELDVQDVWNAFFLYALLLDNQVHGKILHLSHTAPSQSERLRPALHERNLRIAGVGQPGWNHACNLCCSIYIDEDGNEYVVRSTVTDGITIGCPCCAVHDCLKPLVSVKHRYCTLHRALNKQCAATMCERNSETGFCTCPDPEHHHLKSYHYLQGKAMFQLKHRLKRLKVSQTHDSLAPGSRTSPNCMADKGDGDLMPELVDARQDDDEDDEGAAEGHGVDADEDVEIDVAGICEGKPETGSKTVRALALDEGVHITSSSALNGVREFWMKLFPTKASLPQVLWHDNNCRMVAMLKNNPEEYLRNYFDHCALPVDVFHFKSKFFRC